MNYRVGGCGLYLSGSCEHDTEPSGFIKDEQILEWLSDLVCFTMGVGLVNGMFNMGHCNILLKFNTTKAVIFMF
jgi:hypothetical protein